MDLTLLKGLAFPDHGKLVRQLKHGYTLGEAVYLTAVLQDLVRRKTIVLGGEVPFPVFEL